MTGYTNIPEMPAGKRVDAAKPLSPPTADRLRFWCVIRIRQHHEKCFPGVEA
jgi:hypothetical protein